MKLNQRGFGLIEQLVVTAMGAVFVLMFIHGTLVVVDRFFSVQTVTDFDEDRKILRAQVASWSATVFSSEIYLSNELLAEFNVERVDGKPILPYAGSFGSGLVLQQHVIKDGALHTPATNPEAFDISVVITRNPEGDSLTVTDDESAILPFPGNPGLYKFNQAEPYLYVDRQPSHLKIGDYVALSSVAGAGFARIKSIADKKITFDFTGLGEFRPTDPAGRESPFVVFYKGGTITQFQIMFVGVNVSNSVDGQPTMVVGRMNPKGSGAPMTLIHSLQLPVLSLRLVRGGVTTIPGGTFIPFETPQQLAASMWVPSFLSTRLNQGESKNFFDSEMTFLVPL